MTPDVFKVLEENFALMFGFAVIWIVGWSAYFAWRRHRLGPIHPAFGESDVRFIERFASGFSHKNLFTRFGGAHNALVVRVLEAGLLIEPIPIFKWVMPPGFNDLEHYVPRKNILSIQPSSSFGRQTLKIQFRARDGILRTLELGLRKPKEFQLALSTWVERSLTARRKACGPGSGGGEPRSSSAL